MWQYIKQHPLPSIGIAIGVAINVGSRMNDLYSLLSLGLPVQAWEAIGALIFFGSVVVLLYRWRTEQDGTKTKPAEQSPTLPTLPTSSTAQLGTFNVSGGNVIVGSHDVVAGTERQAPQQKPISPLATRDEFRDEEIFIPNLLRRGNAFIREKTFIGCTLYGPAMITFQRCNMSDITLDVFPPFTPDDYFLAIMEDRTVIGPILFVDCRFLKCHLQDISFIGPKQFIDMVKSAFVSKPDPLVDQFMPPTRKPKDEKK